MYKKKMVSCILLVAILISIFSSFSYATASSIDTSSLDKGVISVNHASGSDAKVVIKKGEKKYTYDLNKNNVYPLTMGNGEYEVSVLEKLYQNKYQVVDEDTVKLDIKDSNIVFLQSVQQINWNAEMAAIKKAATLTQNKKSDIDKAAAIYNYIVRNFKYDKNKISTIKEGYIPDIDSVYKDTRGVCYDFAVLYAAMLRSVGIPAKLVMGYKNDINVYHTWNQVYLKESKKWITVDTTYDLLLLNGNKKATMIKNNTLYKMDKVY
jgi:transglutaminase-like putative cysteine protease